MRIGEKGLLLLKDLEGYEDKVYLDTAGLPTIGYGHKIEPYEHLSIVTEEQAENLLLKDIEIVETCINNWVLVPLVQEEFDALVCLVYNIGCHAFHSSTLLKMLNVEDFDEAAKQFLVWNKDRENGKLVVNKGLMNRREREQKLFLGETE
jgi:lysozyme